MRNWKTWDNQGVRENVPDADECFCSLEVNELLLGYETFLSRFNGESPAARVRRDESRSVRDCTTNDVVRAMCGKFHNVRAGDASYKSRWRTNSSASIRGETIFTPRMALPKKAPKSRSSPVNSRAVVSSHSVGLISNRRRVGLLRQANAGRQKERGRGHVPGFGRRLLSFRPVVGCW